ARRVIENGSGDHASRQHVIQLAVEGIDQPLPGKEVDDQPQEVNGERNQQRNPRGGIADNPIPEIGLGLAIVRDVRSECAAGKASGKPAPGADRGYDGEPDPVAAVGTVSVKIGCEMTGEDPENPDPDGNVQHAVVVFVSFTLNDFFHHYFVWGRCSYPDCILIGSCAQWEVGTVSVFISASIWRNAWTTRSGWSSWIQCA